MGQRPVVFGVDFTTDMQATIAWARRALTGKSPVVLAHAIDEPPRPRFLRSIPSAVAAERVAPAVRARVELIASRAGLTDAECITRAGRADRVLIDIARERDANLLVIGPHGLPTRPWKRLGTTAERLLRAGERSVLVAKGPMEGAPRRILVAVDDADITPRLLARAGAIADSHGAEIHAVHALSRAAYSHMLSAEWAEAKNEAEVAARIEAGMAEETLRWLRELWVHTKLRSNIHAEVPHGVPADEILRLARRLPADLIVVGRYGMGRVVPAILGSVAGSVIAGADCPVLVVAG